jgi:hypothetical protein
MQALRKPADPVLTTPPAQAATVERVTPVDYQSAPAADGSLPTSPAILLQEQLAARLAGAQADTAQTLDMVGAPEVKLPMALRIATIVALSLVLWGGIFFTAVKTLT